MKLDRNINPDGKGKYALVRLRGDLSPQAIEALRVLEAEGRIDYGTVGSSEEFFPIKLKDKYAAIALYAYASAAELDDAEYGNEVFEMVRRAGPNHPNCKVPD